MKRGKKYNQILDALQTLLESKDLQKISVNDIALTAGIGKGSVYYYFTSKEAILEALIERNYEMPIQTAKDLAQQTEISPFTRMAMIFQTCLDSSAEFLLRNKEISISTATDQLLLHKKYLNYLVTELKPALTLIIEQGIANGELYFDYPKALADIVLIVLAVRLDNAFIPCAPKEIEETILGLISLLEKGTDNPAGSLNFLLHSLNVN